MAKLKSTTKAGSNTQLARYVPRHGRHSSTYLHEDVFFDFTTHEKYIFRRKNRKCKQTLWMWQIWPGSPYLVLYFSHLPLCWVQTTYYTKYPKTAKAKEEEEAAAKRETTTYNENVAIAFVWSFVSFVLCDMFFFRRRRESLLCLPFYYDVHAKHIHIKDEKKETKYKQRLQRWRLSKFVLWNPYKSHETDRKAKKYETKNNHTPLSKSWNSISYTHSVVVAVMRFSFYFLLGFRSLCEPKTQTALDNTNSATYLMLYTLYCSVRRGSLQMISKWK